jgi:hypothetical protein
MITRQASISASKLGSGQEPSNKQRRNFIGGSLAALAASPLLVSPRRAMAEEKDAPNNPFILLLAGVYQPVVHGPNLGLSRINLNDGSYAVTRIYPVWGIGNEEVNTDQDNAIGNFYVQFAGSGLCAYQLPGGAIAMQFTGGGFTLAIPDRKGGQFLEGTFPLTILQATGVYRDFQGGHNHMVDRLHQLSISGGFSPHNLDEFCFCYISQYQFPS